MILLRKFSEKEVLEIVARYACENLPETSHGVIEAKYNKKNGIQVYFIESKTESEIPS